MSSLYTLTKQPGCYKCQHYERITATDKHRLPTNQHIGFCIANIVWDSATCRDLRDYEDPDELDQNDNRLE